jgi:hypothetical protein
MATRYAGTPRRLNILLLAAFAGLALRMAALSALLVSSALVDCMASA